MIKMSKKLSKKDFDKAVAMLKKYIPLEQKLWKQEFGKHADIPESQMRSYLRQYCRGLHSDGVDVREITRVINQALINEGLYT